jgi:hypothetical protein
MALPAPPGVAASGQPPTGDAANYVASGVLSGVGPGQAFSIRGPFNLFIWAAINTALTIANGSLTASVASATGLAAGDAINSAKVPLGTTIGAISGTTVTLAPPPVTLYGTTNLQQQQISGLLSTAGLLNAAVTGPGIPAGTTVTGILQAAVPPTNNSAGVPGIVAISNLPTSAPNLYPVAQPFVFAVGAAAITAASGADSAATFTGNGIVFTGTVQLERSFDGGSTFIVCNGSIGAYFTPAQWTSGPVSVAFGEPEKQMLYRLNCLAYSSGPINYRASATGQAAETLGFQLI